MPTIEIMRQIGTPSLGHYRSTLSVGRVKKRAHYPCVVYMDGIV